MKSLTKGIILHLDATGSITSKPQFCTKSVYYYALTLQHPDYQIAPILVAEMTGGIMSKSCDESRASFAYAGNCFRIVKHPILETKVNVRAGNFIRTMYDNIHDRISAFNFGFHPLAPKIFKSRKRKLEIQNEEDSKEKWCLRSKCQKSYINPDLCRVDKVFEAINVVNKFEENL